MRYRNCCSAPVETYRVAEEDQIFEAFDFAEHIDEEDNEDYM